MVSVFLWCRWLVSVLLVLSGWLCWYCLILCRLVVLFWLCLLLVFVWICLVRLLCRWWWMFMIVLWGVFFLFCRVFGWLVSMIVRLLLGRFVCCWFGIGLLCWMVVWLFLSVSLVWMELGLLVCKIVWISIGVICFGWWLFWYCLVLELNWVWIVRMIWFVCCGVVCRILLIRLVSRLCDGNLICSWCLLFGWVICCVWFLFVILCLNWLE